MVGLSGDTVAVRASLKLAEGSLSEEAVIPVGGTADTVTASVATRESTRMLEAIHGAVGTVSVRHHSVTTDGGDERHTETRKVLTAGGGRHAADHSQPAPLRGTSLESTEDRTAPNRDAVLLAMFEIVRWGEEGLPPDTFATLLRDRRLDPFGRDKHHRSLMMVAAKQNQVEMLRMIVDAFGCIPLLTMVDESGSNALHYACMYGCRAAAEVIIEAATQHDEDNGDEDNGGGGAGCNMINALFKQNAHGSV